MTVRPTAAVAALWLIWLIGWWVSAAASARTVSRPSASSQLKYSLLTWAGAVLLFMHPRSASGLLQPLVSSSALSWTGVALVAIGLGFSVWARVHLGRLWSARVTLKEGHAIVRTGPYGFVRHPIYTGLVIAILGTLLTEITVAAMAGVVLITTGFVIKLRQEERLLTDHFGAAYDVYRAEVRGLIPYIW